MISVFNSNNTNYSRNRKAWVNESRCHYIKNKKVFHINEHQFKRSNRRIGQQQSQKQLLNHNDQERWKLFWGTISASRSVEMFVILTEYLNLQNNLCYLLRQTTLYHSIMTESDWTNWDQLLDRWFNLSCVIASSVCCLRSLWKSGQSMDRGRCVLWKSFVADVMRVSDDSARGPDRWPRGEQVSGIPGT